VYDGERTVASQFGMYLFILGPFAALVAAVPLTWVGEWAGSDLVLAGAFYTVTCLV